MNLQKLKDNATKGSSPTEVIAFRVSDIEKESFKQFCAKENLKPGKVLRILVNDLVNGQ